MVWIAGIINRIGLFIAEQIIGKNSILNNSNKVPVNEVPVEKENSVSEPSPDIAGFDDSRIRQDYSITQKWHPGWKRPLEQVKEVVIHHTAGTGNIDTLKKWMLSGERKEQYTKGISLFHFAIDRDGKIWKAGPVSRWWYHSCSGKHDKVSIGIENIHKTGPFTDAQYENLFWLIFEYIPRICISYNRIVSHDYNYNTYSNMKKGCPGPDFDWVRLENEMMRRNINFETHGFEEYTIKFPV